MHAFRAWSRVIWTKAIWRPIWRPELDHKVGIFVKKSISQKLKKSKKFSFRNSPFTRQHNISLNGTNSKDIRSRVSEMFYQQPKHARLVSCQCDATVLSTTVWRKPFSKEMTFWWYLKQNWTTQMSNSRYIASMEMQDLNTNLVSLWVTAQSTSKEPYFCILKLFWSTLKDLTMKFKIYCTEMHDLSENVNLSRVCGSI